MKLCCRRFGAERILGCHEKELNRLRRATVGKISRKGSWRKPMRTPYKNKRKIKIEGRNKRKRLRKEKFERPWNS